MAVDTFIPRTRDCYTLVKGETFTATVDSNLATLGWPGGVGVQWTTSTKDEFMVTLSNGYVSGFLLWGSNESSDQFTSMTQNQPYYRFAVLCTGSWLMLTQQYEQYTYASRHVGPLVALTYNPDDKLLFSLRGYWTKEDEWTLSGDPRAPNTNVVGFVAQVPNASTGGYMTIQTAI
jgi:hypothetical protein